VSGQLLDELGSLYLLLGRVNALPALRVAWVDHIKVWEREGANLYSQHDQYGCVFLVFVFVF
jgi:hypothetical protein